MGTFTGVIIALIIIDTIGYAIRATYDSSFAQDKTRMYPFMWAFYQNK